MLSVPCLTCPRSKFTSGWVIAEVYLDTGTYASFGPAVGALLSEMAPGPYRTPNVRVRTQVVYTNGPLAGAMRGFGAPQALFAVESMMDMMAAELGMDPIEFRRKNLWRQGERTPLGVLLSTVPSLAACLERAARERERLRQTASSPGKSSGVGVAAGIQPMGKGYGIPNDSTSRVEWLPDGRVRLDVGAPEWDRARSPWPPKWLLRHWGLALNQSRSLVWIHLSRLTAA